MTEYAFEVWQYGYMQAGGTTTDADAALQEAEHYEMVYGGDGPVTLKFYARRELTRDEMKAAIAD